MKDLNCKETHRIERAAIVSKPDSNTDQQHNALSRNDCLNKSKLANAVHEIQCLVQKAILPLRWCMFSFQKNALVILHSNQMR